MNFRYYLKQKEANLKEIIKRFSYWFEYIFWLLFSVSKFKRFPESAKKILIISTGALGDAFCAFRTAYNISLNNRKRLFTFISLRIIQKILKMFKEVDNLKFISEKEISVNRFDITLLFSLNKNLIKYRKILAFVSEMNIQA